MAIVENYAVQAQKKSCSSKPQEEHREIPKRGKRQKDCAIATAKVS